MEKKRSRGAGNVAATSATDSSDHVIQWISRTIYGPKRLLLDLEPYKGETSCMDLCSDEIFGTWWYSKNQQGEGFPCTGCNTVRLVGAAANNSCPRCADDSVNQQRRRRASNAHASGCLDAIRLCKIQAANRIRLQSVHLNSIYHADEVDDGYLDEPEEDLDINLDDNGVVADGEVHRDVDEEHGGEAAEYEDDVDLQMKVLRHEQACRKIGLRGGTTKKQKLRANIEVDPEKLGSVRRTYNIPKVFLRPIYIFCLPACLLACMPGSEGPTLHAACFLLSPVGAATDSPYGVAEARGRDPATRHDWLLDISAQAT